MLKVIKNAIIYTDKQILTNKSIIIKDSKIIDISQNPQLAIQHEIIDLKGKSISAGFIDIQINGGKYKYFSQKHDQQTLQDIYQTCLEYGTPYILPTIISSPIQNILHAIESVRKYRQKHKGVLGMHLQGPYFNEKKRGAHGINMIRKPTNQQLKQIIQKGKDIIKVMTIAPQCFTQEQLQMLIKSGIKISMGHTQLTYAQSQKYFNKGINLITHLYNAMTQMGQRQCGTVGAVFDNQNVYASIILDGGHCHYAAARIAKKIKGDKLFLITDSSFLGRHRKQFCWQGWNIEMKDGFYRDKDGNLAGAAISMPQAIKNAIDNLGISLKQAIQMATSRVAKAIGMQKQIGYIQIGYPATFSVFDESLKNVQSLIL